MPNIADARRTYAASLAFVPNREELPTILNTRELFGCGVEVGVKEGEFSEHILKNWQGAHLISVDPWREDAPKAYLDIANVAQPIHDQFFEQTIRRLRLFGGRSSVWRITSAEASQRIPHHSLDFVYLDARHDYASVLEDLEAWFDKVRPGGIIAGHDYIDGVFPNAGVFGVQSAVDEFFGRKGLAVYATLLDEPAISWMVEIPSPLELRSANEPVLTDIPARVAAGPAPNRRQVEFSFGTPRGRHSFKLNLDPAQISQRLMLECVSMGRFYEDETSRFLAYALGPGDSFIDVGGHVGYFSMAAASLVGPSGRVFCFEPDEANYRHIQDHLTLNGFDHVQAFNVAVSNVAGSCEFFVNIDNDGGHALWDVGLHDFNTQSRATPQMRIVPTVSLDQQLAGEDLSRLKVIKIDAEGCEGAVLQGARGILEGASPTVICEINHFGLNQMGTSEAEIRQLMCELGYSVYAFSPESQELVRLEDDQTIVSTSVFNLAFIHPTASVTGAAA